MKFRRWVLLCLFLLSSCGGSDEHASDSSVNGVTINQDQPKAGHLDRAEYSSRNCSAVVSSSEAPTRVLMDVRCGEGGWGGGTGQYVLTCASDERRCEETYNGGRKAEVAFSESFAQAIFTLYTSSGSVDYWESFLCNKNCRNGLIRKDPEKLPAHP
jgi:hypothetical protein